MITTDRVQIEPQEIPSFFEQRPKFLSLPRLRLAALDPERSPEVRDAKRQLAIAIAADAALHRIADRLRQGELTLDGPTGEQYILRSPSTAVQTGSVQLAAAGSDKIEVRIRTRGLVNQRLEAEAGEIEIAVDELSAEPRLNIDLRNVTVIDATLPRPTSLRDRPLRLLRLDEPVLAPLESASIASLRQTAEKNPSPEVKRASDHLASRLVELQRNIASQLHGRAATAVNCVLVLTLGAVMSMLLRGRVPLAIFFWCFVPTVLSFLCINSGQNMIEFDKTAAILGIAMTWAGNAGLLLMILGVYWKLCKN